MSPYLFKEDVYYFIINIYYLFILIVRPAPRAGPQRSEGPLPILYTNGRGTEPRRSINNIINCIK